MPAYDHTQRSAVHWLVISLGVVMIGATIHPMEAIPLAFGVLLVLFVGSLAHLHVWDDGDGLGVRFGPLPLFGTHIPYAGMESVDIVPIRWYRTGVGMFILPGAGLALFLRGRRAVAVHMTAPGGPWRYSRYVIGTDEPEALAAFLNGKLSEAGAR